MTETEHELRKWQLHARSANCEERKNRLKVKMLEEEAIQAEIDADRCALDREWAESQIAAIHRMLGIKG